MEINPDNEALTQLRPYWDKICCILMRKLGLKEITLDLPDFQTLETKMPYLCVLGRKKLGSDKGFTLIVADSEQEMLEIIAKHQGKG